MSTIKSNKGSATILTILMASVIITVGLGFNWMVREHLSASEGFKKKAEAMLKARSAYESIIYLLLTGQTRQREITLVVDKEISEITSLPLNGQPIPLIKDELSVRIQESNGLLSLVNLDIGALQRLLKMKGGLDDPSASGIINSFFDWIDPDNLVRVNGAEAFYYKGEGKPYTPRNFALQFKEELEWIKGIGRPLFQKIASQVTTLPVTGFNPNTASDDVLTAYLNLTPETLQVLKEAMVQKPLSSDAELLALTGRKIGIQGEGYPFFPSPFLEVTVQVGQPRGLFAIRAGLDIRQDLHSPFRVLYWVEE